MDKICNRCIAVRCLGIGKLLNKTAVRTSSVCIGQVGKREPIFNSSFQFRNYAVKARSSEQVWKYGKLVGGEVEDPTIYPNLLMIFNGYDESVLETYFTFAKKAAKMVDLNVNKTFNMPAKEEVLKSEILDEENKKNVVQYKLKRYERVISVGNLGCDKSDIYFDFIHKELPPGVDISMQKMSWEKYACPDHITVRDSK